jgi:hypothetical protein
MYANANRANPIVVVSGSVSINTPAFFRQPIFAQYICSFAKLPHFLSTVNATLISTNKRNIPKDPQESSLKHPSSCLMEATGNDIKRVTMTLPNFL